MNTIAASDFAQVLRTASNIKLLDVRTPGEFREVHVKGAFNVPLADLKADDYRNAGTVYVICQKGGRGQKACESLAQAGITTAINVEGGTLACIEAGVPVVRGKKGMSLERQVRIAAGALVLIGAILSQTVHIGFIGISSFVGAGLMFSGLTDTCGMGAVLARMPWNRSKAACSTN